ncbi:C45 family autoproteolytic acyltransferase/hydolase [Robertmurraya andreesenii]|uniref:Choloylglycine hydrolase n=1 Tax=Anoxybacillus andreesenii TaxID=1325932 RepID=A0ABT9V184_9BACL|nr:C45 family peptidase [Robertmurraya andreesenii]MDQ0154702.1 putative choloylglycine hydrolase [Robertmurraya andreesenii]
MSEFFVNIFQIRDTSFNIGLKLGKYLQNKPLLKVLDSITRPEIDYENMKTIYSALAPHLIEELDGLANGLEISSKKSASLLSGYDVPMTEAMGCSAIITKDYYVRNYDFSPALYDGIFSLVQSEEAFATAGYNLQVLGRHDGINEKGLVAGLHFVSNNSYSKGISPWTAIRMVLDMCSSVDEAIQMLKEIPHAACYNFSLGDKNDNMAVVEASPEKVMVRLGQSSLSCVNHFQDEMLQNKNRVSIDGSVKRNRYLQEISNKNLTHEEMFDEFKDKNSPLFFTDYENLFGTLHTLSYSYQNSRIITTIAQSEHVLDFNFQDWVDGENVEEQMLRGIID